MALTMLVAVVFNVVVCGTLYRVEAIPTMSVFCAVVPVVLVWAAIREREHSTGARIANTEEVDVAFGLGDAFYDVTTLPGRRSTSPCCWS